MLIPILQIIVSVAIVALILLQERGGGLSGILGGAESAGVYQTRRGAEKLIFWGTIFFSVVFVILAILSLLL